MSHVEVVQLTWEQRNLRALVAAMRYVQAGWTQGAYCRNRAGTAVMPDDPGVKRVDLAYALRRAAQDFHLDEDKLRAVVQVHLPAKFRDDEWGLEHWNDGPYRTRTEVILLLERAAGCLDG